MARTNLTVKTQPSLNGTIVANSFDDIWTAADVTNKNQCDLLGDGLYLEADNTGAAPYTVTINSAPDELLRSGDITAYSLGIGERATFGPFPVKGWSNSGKLYFEAENVAVKFKAFRA